MPRWRAERRGVHRRAPMVRPQAGHPPGAIRALRLVGAPSPLFRGKEERGSRANPRAQQQEQGPIFLCLNVGNALQGGTLFDNRIGGECGATPFVRPRGSGGPVLESFERAAPGSPLCAGTNGERAGSGSDRATIVPGFHHRAPKDARKRAYDSIRATGCLTIEWVSAGGATISRSPPRKRGSRLGEIGVLGRWIRSLTKVGPDVVTPTDHPKDHATLDSSAR